MAGVEQDQDPAATFSVQVTLLSGQRRVDARLQPGDLVWRLQEQVSEALQEPWWAFHLVHDVTVFRSTRQLNEPVESFQIAEGSHLQAVMINLEGPFWVQTVSEWESDDCAWYGPYLNTTHSIVITEAEAVQYMSGPPNGYTKQCCVPGYYTARGTVEPLPDASELQGHRLVHPETSATCLQEWHHLYINELREKMARSRGWEGPDFTAPAKLSVRAAPAAVPAAGLGRPSPAAPVTQQRGQHTAPAAPQSLSDGAKAELRQALLLSYESGKLEEVQKEFTAAAAAAAEAAAARRPFWVLTVSEWESDECAWYGPYLHDERPVVISKKEALDYMRLPKDGYTKRCCVPGFFTSTGKVEPAPDCLTLEDQRLVSPRTAASCLQDWREKYITQLRELMR